MLNPEPIDTLIDKLIFERDKVVEALQSDENNKELQKKLAAWRAGYTLPAESQPIFEDWSAGCVVPIKSLQNVPNGTPAIRIRSWMIEGCIRSLCFAKEVTLLLLPDQ